ncbi:retinol dehydrogenase 14 [Phyllobates terribilis]|uniref:retinol dehydrogenase 14 n=1 Tax=Phyllobates terribilis TaxID=111132 RepID=UPI003CCB476B
MAGGSSALMVAAAVALGGGLILVARRLMSSSSARSAASALMRGKTVIITGANCGIGRATAAELLRLQARVILACRDPERAEEAARELREETGGSGEVVVKQLDLSSMASVRRFCQEVVRVRRGGAGVRACVCCFAYSRSKLANILFTRELARRLEGTGVTVNVLHPGIVRTNLGRHINIPVLVKPLFNVVSWAFFKSPAEGAQTSVFLASSPEVEGVSGKYFGDCKEEDLIPKAMDDLVGRKLWDISEVMVGLIK